MGLLIALREALTLTRAHEYPPAEPLRASDDGHFADLVRLALDQLPEALLPALDNAAVLIADGGDAASAYGLYHGAGVAHGDTPAQIVIFRDTLVRDFAHDPRLLAEQVRRTVRHEIAHHLGYDEPAVAALGL